MCFIWLVFVKWKQKWDKKTLRRKKKWTVEGWKIRVARLVREMMPEKRGYSRVTLVRRVKFVRSRHCYVTSRYLPRHCVHSWLTLTTVASAHSPSLWKRKRRKKRDIVDVGGKTKKKNEKSLFFGRASAAANINPGVRYTRLELYFQVNLHSNLSALIPASSPTEGIILYISISSLDSTNHPRVELTKTFSDLEHCLLVDREARP